jgi:hypothetical protein
MDKQEFFLLIPAIIYGVAIVDLLKIFNHKKNYPEMVGWGLFLLIGIIYNWIELFNKLDLIIGGNVSFFLIIFQAILFSRAAAIITPEEKNNDTKKYFMENRVRFFWFLSFIVAYGMIMRYFVYDDQTTAWLRPLFIVLYLGVAYSNKYWLRISIMILALVLILARVFSGSLS